LSIKLFGGRRA